MEVLKAICGFYMILYLWLLLIGLILRIEVDQTYQVISLLFALSVGVYGFCLEPSRALDLSRLQNYIRTLRFSGNSFFSKIWGAAGIMGGYSTKGMLGWNMLCYIVQLLGDVNWLSAISVMIIFATTMGVIVDFAINKGYDSRAVGIGVALTFMGMQVQYVFSGIRNALAVSLAVLALYLIFYRKKHFVLSGILLLLAVTTHTMVAILAVPIVLAKIKKQRLVRGIALFTLPIMFEIAEALQKMSIPFVSTVVSRILFYTSVQYPYDRPEMIANIVVFIVVGFVYWLLLKREYLEESEFQRLYMNAYYLLGTMMIGCSAHRDFTLRIGYLMGIATVPVICRFFELKEWNKFTSVLSYIVMLTVLACCTKVFYDTAFVMSQWSFG